MPTIPQSEIPCPKSWDEFEDIVADLYARAWDDPHTRRYGRAGQAQQGVDICGRPARLQGRYAGVQCKRYEWGTLTLKAVEAEIARAEEFKPPLAEYTIATSERRDARLQEAVRLITQEREAAGKFAVHVVFWEDLSSLLAYPNNSDLLRKHYGDWVQRFGGPAARYVAPLPDPDVLPDPGPLPPRFRIPFQRNALFTGRVGPLQALARALLHSEAGSALVVGMGGVGKTQLAVEFAYRYGRFFHGVHWISAGEPEAIGAEVAACGEAMGLPDWPEKQPEQVARTLSEWQQGGRRLVVLDDLEEVGAAQEWLARLSAAAVCVLVTARRTDWPADLGLRPLRLESFTPEESLAFLRQHLPDGRATEADLRALAERLYHLPLALELAGRYLGAHARLSVEAYLGRLESIWEHPSMAGWREELGNPTEHDLRLAETFAVSWERVEDETARRVFLLAGYCAPDQPIPCELLEEAAGIDREACDGALGVLAGLGLLEMGDPEVGPTIDPLLAEYGRAIVPSAPEGEEILGVLAGALSRLARAANAQMDQTGSPSHFVPLLPHVRLVAERTEEEGLEGAANLWGSLGYYLRRVADYIGARAAFERALAIDERAFGPDHPNVATAVNNLGSVLQGLGDLAGARAAYERALAIDERAFGPDHRNVATDVNNLGLVLQSLGDLAGARAAFERALAIDEKTYGLDHPYAARDLSNLGSVLYDLDEVARAQAAFERALTIDEKAYGPSHPSVAGDRDNLAMALYDLEGLVKACLDGSCVLFAGSGLSECAGLPGWDAFVEGLRAWAVEQGYIGESQGASLRRSIEAGDSSVAAHSIASTLQRRGRQAELNAYLGRIFEDPALQPTEIHHILQGIHFGAALTPTYDRLLEQTFQPAPKIYAPADAESLLHALAKREFFLLKLRGTLDRPETVMLAPTQYQDTLASNRMLAQFMSSLFVSQTIFFLGASLDEILTYCEGIMFAEAARQHYAIVPVSGSAWEVKVEQLRQRYNIQVLPYQSREVGPELALVRALARRVQAKASTLSLAKRRRKRSRLKAVRLENIGPFQEFSLDLDAHWSILLGDNGVGKSTVLKAIALAICGDDAQPYADRLIRVGAPIGRITLETTEGARYVTELRRTAAEAEVVSVPQRLLEIEGWLALGFPPLRWLGWQASPGPQSGPAKRPLSPADLLPLVTGALDPRINDLKQWIINLDYRAKKAKGKRAQQLFDTFFETVGHLTVGMKLGKGKVVETKDKAYQVMVETDDGEVPIELVSQGTQSLLGWVGVLMERMYEQYDRANQPWKQPALVLIDEIDAHMHPLWQQAIVPGLSELFPKVQFVATTHSPLVVAEATRDQVRVLVRDPDSNKVVVNCPDEDFNVLRADQMLTSSLFDLTRTRGSKAAADIASYADLLGKSKRTPEEERRLEELRAKLSAGFMSSDTPARRQVEEAVRVTLRQMPFEGAVRKVALGADLSEDMKLEIKRQLAELFAEGEEQA